jgi:hypothetical protein
MLLEFRGGSERKSKKVDDMKCHKIRENAGDKKCKDGEKPE